jgi:K+-sensing histidine kinase KdpD
MIARRRLPTQPEPGFTAALARGLRAGRRLSAGLRLLAALPVLLVSLLLAFAFTSLNSSVPHAFIGLGVFVATLLFGVLAGIFCALVGTGLVIFFFIDPWMSFRISSLADAAVALFFLLCANAAVIVVEALYALGVNDGED